jgi:hypothetical protein
MEQTRFSDSLMISYLLGRPFPAEEKSKLEEAIFNEDETFEQMSAVESALIDDYVRGDLSSEERARFEKYYLSSSERLERVYCAQALATAASQFKPKEKPILLPTGAAESTWWQKLLASLSGPLLIPKGAYAVLGALLMLAIGGWFVIENIRVRERLIQEHIESQRRERESKQETADLRMQRDIAAEELERERALRRSAEIEKAQIARLTPKVIASFVLTSDFADSRRNSLDPNSPPSERVLKLVIPKDAAEVQLQLDLKESGYTDYQAILKSVSGQEKEIWRAIRVKKSQSGATVSLRIPSQLFTPGRYDIDLNRLDPGGLSIPVEIYSFIVERR